MTAPERPRSSHRFQILLCEGPSCGITHESECLKHHLEGKIAADPDLKSRVHVFDYMCFGRCSEGPNMFVRRLAPGERADVEPPATAFMAEQGFYPEMTAEKCDRVLVGHCGFGEPIKGLVEDY
jgi:(2Fe-2S) ferredoxin